MRKLVTSSCLQNLAAPSLGLRPTETVSSPDPGRPQPTVCAQPLVTPSPPSVFSHLVFQRFLSPRTVPPSSLVSEWELTAEASSAPPPPRVVRFDPPFTAVHSSAILPNQVPFFFVIHWPFSGFLVRNTLCRIDYVLSTFYFCHTPPRCLISLSLCHLISWQV